MKLLLVYPEIESSNTNTSTYSLPLGLGSIATYCKRELEDSLEVRILDGSMVSHKEHMEEVRRFAPDVTGINSTIASQNNAYEIGRLAKKTGSKVIFGGVHSTNLWENMLRNRDFIDGVILYDGEIPMAHVLKGNDFESIPNLAFKDSDGNVKEPATILIPRLDDLTDIDYSLFEMKRFLEQTQRRGFGKAVTYYSGKGCAKRGGLQLKQVYSYEEYKNMVNSMANCSFCGRNELGFRTFDEEREAKVLKRLNEEYGITGFFNVQDTVNLRNATPVDLDSSCWFRLFIGIEDIIPSNIAKLKQRYGSNLILQAGIEAANPEMRKAYGKKVTDLRDVISKVELMGGEGIQLHASFILGGRGETKKSMHQTTEAARKLAEYDNVTWILISPQLILPGSPDYRRLLDIQEMHKRYAGQDLINIVEINKDFLAHFTPTLAREEIVEEIRNAFEDIKRTNSRITLDVKGVVNEEEKQIHPQRSYV
jgi:radical SAM superfamily enzyme YgiQ (UPF0313 family)